MLLNYIYGDTLRFEFKQESVRQDLKENDLIPALKKLLTHEEELAEIQRRKELQAEIEKKASWAENWGLPRLKALVEQSFWVRIEILSVSVKFKHFFAKFLELENSLSNAKI
jgi:TPP-dependent pyruvate/acetoin dehydrogenase alpha subunit